MDTTSTIGTNDTMGATDTIDTMATMDVIDTMDATDTININKQIVSCLCDIKQITHTLFTTRKYYDKSPSTDITTYNTLVTMLKNHISKLQTSYYGLMHSLITSRRYDADTIDYYIQIIDDFIENFKDTSDPRDIDIRDDMIVYRNAVCTSILKYTHK